jgi:hypothetical protein
MPDGPAAAIEADTSLDQTYARAWVEGAAAMRAGTCQPDTPPAEGDPRWGLSVVIGIDGEVRDRLATDLAAMRALCPDRHLVYLPEHLHCTVRSLEGYQDRVPAEQVDHYVEQLSTATADLPPLRLRVDGLGGSPGGVFALGYPTASLHTLRARLHEAACRTGPLSVAGSDARRVRNTAHVSMVVFGEPIRPEPRLADHVAERRDTTYGTVDVTALSLVRYRWADGTVRMRRLARIPMAR